MEDALNAQRRLISGNGDLGGRRLARTAGASVQGVMDEEVTLQAKVFLALRAAINMLVTYRSLARKAGDGCPSGRQGVLWHLLEGLQCKQVVVGASEMRRRNQRQAAALALHGKVAVLAVALRAEVAALAEPVRGSRAVQVAEAERRLALALGPVEREPHPDQGRLGIARHWWWNGVLEEDVPEVVLVHDDAVGAARALGQLAADVHLGRQSHHAAADVALAHALDGCVDVARIARGQAPQDDQHLPTGVYR